MSFKEWKLWVKRIPPGLKWFPYLILFRPLIDSLFFLKSVSPLLSPPYIVGIASPILCLYGILKYKKANNSLLDLLFSMLTIIVTISMFSLFLFEGFSFYFFQFLIKLTLPFFLYFFLRRFIRSTEDLEGIMQTFLYSTIYVVFIFLYEIFINPISVQESRGLTRIQGLFGDVINYSIYIVFGLLIVAYFFLKYHKTKLSKKYLLLLIATIFLATGIAANIHHSATWATLIIIIGLLFNFYFKTNKNSALIILFVLVPIFMLLGKDIFMDQINPLIESDVAVFEGRKAEERLLHGRVGRWKVMWEDFSSQGMVPQFIGYTASLKYCLYYIGTGAHNDYFRILMLSGYIGLTTYIFILINAFKKAYVLALNQRFFVIGGLIILTLLSISVTPTIYAPFLYILMSIFAYISLPRFKNEK